MNIIENAVEQVRQSQLNDAIRCATWKVSRIAELRNSRDVIDKEIAELQGELRSMEEPVALSADDILGGAE